MQREYPARRGLAARGRGRIVNRRQVLGAALGGIVAAVVGAKVEAEVAPPVLTITGPFPPDVVTPAPVMRPPALYPRVHTTVREGGWTPALVKQELAQIKSLPEVGRIRSHSLKGDVLSVRTIQQAEQDGEASYYSAPDGEPQAWEGMDADGLLYGPGYRRRFTVPTGAESGYLTCAAWVPGLVERLPAGYTTNDAPTGAPLDGPIDANHVGVQFAQPRKNMLRVVLLDGVRTRGVTEAYAGDYGWVIRHVPGPNGEIAFLDEKGLSAVRERVFGKVEILPWDGA